jgi:hypothetical protein
MVINDTGRTAGIPVKISLLYIGRIQILNHGKWGVAT